MMKSDIGIRVD